MGFKFEISSTLKVRANYLLKNSTAKLSKYHCTKEYPRGVIILFENGTGTSTNEEET